MSQKYKRIQEADQTLWPPLRWVLQAFSSITLAVILLAGVAVFCAMGSVPVGPLAMAGGYALAAALGAAAGWALLRKAAPAIQLLAMTFGAGAGVGLAIVLRSMILQVTGWGAWLERYGGLTMYKLPALEMTELQFYATWPMKLLLVLFVINMVVATIRRIEFHWLNLGVLTVHTGIVLLALGSAIYGQLKVEGDTLLIDPRFGGQPVAHFYDGTLAAVYIDHDGRRLFVPTPDLPRYHDRQPGEMNLPLHDHAAFAELLGDDVQASVVGFIAQGDMQATWALPDAAADPPVNPAVDVVIGHAGQQATFRLVARSEQPEDRVLNMGGLDIGYLVDVDPLWMDDLATRLDGEHGLVVDIPQADYHAVHRIEAGQTLEPGQTGYKLHVDELMPRYPFPVMTEGFIGSEPSVAVVTITRPDGATVQRWVMHPFPQLNQDFVSDPQGGRPIRQAPSKDIRLAYVDASRTRFWVTQPRAESTEGMTLVMRAKGGAAAKLPLVLGQEVAIPLGERSFSITVEAFHPAVVERMQPIPTPIISRDHRELGRFHRSLICVELRRGDWSRQVWLPFTQYLEIADSAQTLATVTVPELGEVKLNYGRVRYPLPYALTLVDFVHKTHPGSSQTADYISNVRIDYPSGEAQTAEIRMNHPLVVAAGDVDAAHGGDAGPVQRLRFGRLKFWQSGWDPQRQSYTILGVGNNVGIYVIAVGGIMMGVGIPWAFYVKPAVLRTRRGKSAEVIS